MIKKTKTKVYDSFNATVVKKITHSCYGDPAGYEEIMFQTPQGDFFLYTRGGADSAYPQEDIKPFTKANAKKWLEQH